MGDFGPVDLAGGVLEFGDERLDVLLVIEVIGIDGCMTDQVGCADGCAALGRCWVCGRVGGLEVGGYTGEVLERVEGVAAVERGGACQVDETKG